MAASYRENDPVGAMASSDAVSKPSNDGIDDLEGAGIGWMAAKAVMTRTV
jgi:hypothetical protein